MKTEMVSYCFNYVCEKLWWIYILQRGGDKMYELYHHGVKGQKWGVRKQRHKNTTSKRNKIGVLQPLYSGLIGASNKMNSDKIIKKNIDSYANTKKDDLEKLNAYNDYKQAGRIRMTKSNAMRQRIKDGDIDANHKFMGKSKRIVKKIQRRSDKTSGFI